MKAIKGLVTTCLAILVAGGLCWAQADGGGRQRQRRPGAQADRSPGTMVMMRVDNMVRMLNTLDLSEEQKQTIETLRTTFNEKADPLVEKLSEKSKALAERQQNDPDDAEGIKQMRQEIDESTQALNQAAGEFMEKARGVLTEEQKQKLQAAPGGGQGGPGGQGQIMQVIRDLMQRVLPFDLRAMRDLDLNDQQRQQTLDLLKQYQEAIEKTRLEYAGKFEGILTEEQKKQYEEIKNNPDAGGMGGRGGRGGRRGGQNGAAPEPPAPPAPAPAPGAGN